MHAMSLLAISWEPQIRGVVVVLIGVAVLCGSVYLLLMTNLGARLGFLVAFAAFFGWMALMSAVWWIYGNPNLGLQGRAASWQPVEVIVGDLNQAATPQVASLQDLSQATTEERYQGWIKLAEDNPARGQAISAADDIIQNKAKIFKSGGYEAQAVYDYGGDRHPMIGPLKIGGTTVIPQIDIFAFNHDARYNLVEIRPVIPQNTEPGKAPPKPVVDESAPPIYIVMVRDLGSARVPASMICLGSSIIFLLSVWGLHNRDKRSQENRRASAGAGAS